MRQLAADYDEGRVQFTPEAELLWQFFSHADYYGPRSRMPFGDLDDSSLLNRLFRSGLLKSRLVTPEGCPLTWPAEPLRWELTPAVDETDDYHLRLVQAGGQPAPPILHILPGAPTLYLTSKGVFAGPEQQQRILEPEGENRIPAPALEGAAGVGLLQKLGVELPPRLRERVRTLSYAITIKCELRQTPAYYGSSFEECRVEVLAEAPTDLFGGRPAGRFFAPTLSLIRSP
jgi:hypothetical protein